VFSVGQGPAYEPWVSWRTDPADGPLRLVQAAILASNAHNSQPWRFRVTNHQIDVYTDPDRNIGDIDPFRREMVISIGCAIENAMLTAPAAGYNADLTLLPDANDPTHMARIALTEAEAETSPLYDAIPNRHTHRGAYDTARPVPQSVIDEMTTLNGAEDVQVFWFTDEDTRQQIGEATITATEALVADEGQATASHAWFRHDWDDLQAKRDGITYDAQKMPTAINFAAKVLPELSLDANNQVFVDVTRDRHVATAMGWGLIAIPDAQDNAQRLETGRLWQRMHLWATVNGLAMQPINQITERADREAQLDLDPVYTNALAAWINDDEWTGIMLFRFGYADTPGGISPRRSVEMVTL
jgi:hypothetical protein